MSIRRDTDDGLDLAGLGKLAKAIPRGVYIQTTDTLLTTFKKLVAPITETTDGLGRYINQKFDNAVKVEKVAHDIYSPEGLREGQKLRRQA